jgi:hypothetical protein
MKKEMKKEIRIAKYMPNPHVKYRNGYRPFYWKDIYIIKIKNPDDACMKQICKDFQGEEYRITEREEDWENGCGNQHNLPEECEFCEKDKNCFYRGMGSDRQYP